MPPFVFLRRDESVQQAPALLFRTIAFADVLTDADAGAIRESCGRPRGIDHSSVTGFRSEVGPLRIGGGYEFPGAPEMEWIRIDFIQDVAIALLNLTDRPTEGAFPFAIHEFCLSVGIAEGDHHRK